MFGLASLIVDSFDGFLQDQRKDFLSDIIFSIFISDASAFNYLIYYGERCLADVLDYEFDKATNLVVHRHSSWA